MAEPVDVLEGPLTRGGRGPAMVLFFRMGTVLHRPMTDAVIALL